MLVDSIVAFPNHAGCERYVRMEYYELPENKRYKTRNLLSLKLKGELCCALV